jgi:hypothetical protein
MFKNPDFQVDEHDPEFIKFHTQSRKAAGAASSSGVLSRFDAVRDDSESDASSASSEDDRSDGADSMDDSGDELLSHKVRRQQQHHRPLSDRPRNKTEFDEQRRAKKLSFYEARGHQQLDSVLTKGFAAKKSQHAGSSGAHRQQQLPFGERMKRGGK